MAFSWLFLGCPVQRVVHLQVHLPVPQLHMKKPASIVVPWLLKGICQSWYPQCAIYQTSNGTEKVQRVRGPKTLFEMVSPALISSTRCRSSKKSANAPSVLRYKLESTHRPLPIAAVKKASISTKLYPQDEIACHPLGEVSKWRLVHVQGMARCGINGCKWQWTRKTRRSAYWVPTQYAQNL